jgi:hypothetical protein
MKWVHMKIYWTKYLYGVFRVYTTPTTETDPYSKISSMAGIKMVTDLMNTDTSVRIHQLQRQWFIKSRLRYGQDGD